MKTPTPSSNYIHRSLGRSLLCLTLLIGCFAVSPIVQALNPAPDGGYPGGNTAEGQNALQSLSTGGYNTAVGYLSLISSSTNSFNTALGAGTLLANIADENTATGAGALLSNTIGTNNTATGAFALVSNTAGGYNTAIGTDALSTNTIGSFNTAVGVSAAGQTTGSDNTAIGCAALSYPQTGSSNTVIGCNAGPGPFAGAGDSNIYIGAGVGPALNSESNTIRIGDNLQGAAACYIGGIVGQTATSGSPVFIDANGKLGTLTSSARFKDDIKAMDQASESIFALKPVTFRYKKEIDGLGTSQFGLVAEDVEKVSPDLVVHDKDGKPYTVRYDAVNAMLLNEFLKEHRKVTKRESTVAEQQKQIEALTAGLQEVKADIETRRLTPQTVVSNQ
jgi:hypothetical protein